MTKEQKMEAFSMLIDGATYEAVAERFGVTRQRIHQIIPMGRNTKPTQKKEKPFRYIYPNIEKWMRENKMSLNDFSAKINHSVSCVNQCLLGSHEPRKRFIDEVLEFTGMTYEEAFRV